MYEVYLKGKNVAYSIVILSLFAIHNLTIHKKINLKILMYILVFLFRSFLSFEFKTVPHTPSVMNVLEEMLGIMEIHTVDGAH